MTTTQKQSLADILNEIEQRSRRLGGGASSQLNSDNAKLVKALRRAIGVCEGLCFQSSETVEIAVERWRNVQHSLAAILTSPENGEQQSFREPGAV